MKEETQVTQITEIKVDKKPLVWTFQVTGEGKTVTLIFNPETQTVSVINQQSDVSAPAPVEQPSETTVTVNEVSGVKQTVTNNVQLIKENKYNEITTSHIVKENTQLTGSQVVQISQVDLGDVIQETSVFQTGSTHHQVTVIVRKETKEVTTIETIEIDTNQFIRPTEVVVTATNMEETFDVNTVFSGSISFIEEKYPQFSQLTPLHATIQEYKTFVELIIVYQSDSQKWKVVLLFTKRTEKFEVISEPVLVGQVKKITLETTITDQGRTNYFTNSIEEVRQVDTNIQTVVEQLTSEISIQTDQVKEVQSNQTSSGATYVFTTETEEGTSQVTVLFNK